MLKHCLIINLYASISDILNNLSVSTVNENLDLSNRIKKYFTYIFEVAHGFAHQINVEAKLVQMIFE